jgi:uncharacterized protein (DUF2235 family)
MRTGVFVNPAEQLTFYDPGIGTEPIQGNVFFRLFRRLHNLVSQATGLGLTLNMIECYAAIIRMWRPEDRIFLFGFSRGAYTVRALGGVLSYCGVPTHIDDGSRLLRDESRRSGSREKQSRTSTSLPVPEGATLPCRNS